MNYYKATIKNTEGRYQNIFLMAETKYEARSKIRAMSDFKGIENNDIEITFIPDENRPNPILLAEKKEYWGRWIWCSKCGSAVSPEYSSYCCHCGEKFTNTQEEEVNEQM